VVELVGPEFVVVGLEKVDIEVVAGCDAVDEDELVGGGEAVDVVGGGEAVDVVGDGDGEVVVVAGEGEAVDVFGVVDPGNTLDVGGAVDDGGTVGTVGTVKFGKTKPVDDDCTSQITPAPKLRIHMSFQMLKLRTVGLNMIVLSSD